MDIIITSENKPQYLLVESKGVLQTTDDLLRHAQLIYEDIVKHNAKKILINEHDTHFPLEITHYFDTVKGYVNTFSPSIRSLKIAVVVSKDYKEVADTWETLCVSRGLQYFAFTSFNEAEC